MPFLIYLYESVISSAPTLVAVALAAWLSRKFVAERLTRSVAFEFDRKLEAQRSEHLRAMELLRARLATEQQSLQQLRGSVLEGTGAWKADVSGRKIQAAMELWASFIATKTYKVAATHMSFVKIDGAVAATTENKNARDVFRSMIPEGYDTPVEAIKYSEHARLFVPQIAWAVYLAYATIVNSAVLRIKMLADGIYLPSFFDDENIKSVIEAAVPGAKDYLDKHGVTAGAHLLDQIKLRLHA
ncbi:MAG: hypothetical protein WAV67_12775, partial [Dokdonella sp.]